MAEARPTEPTLIWSVTEAERLRIACRAASIGVWQWNLLTDEMIYTRTARAICGFPDVGPVTTDMVRKVTHPEDYPRTSALAKRAFDPSIRDSSEFVYRIIRADDGAVRWVKAYGEAQFAVVGGVERAIAFVGSLQDITEEKAREDALAGSEARLRLAMEAGQLAVWEVDVGLDKVTTSPELNRLYGFPEDSTPSMDDYRSRYAPGELERVRTEAEKIVAAGGDKLNFEIRHLWPDGTEKWLLLKAEVGLNAHADGVRVIGVVADITETKKNEERLAIVARELRHRLQNNIAIISALAARSWPVEFQEERRDFQRRLVAIGKATELMFPRSDVIEQVTVERLLQEITGPYRSEAQDPFSFDGPDAPLPDRHVRPLAMAIHELATNAVKYGALSVAEGKVIVRWQAAKDGALTIEWRETDGPPVAPPQNAGLGSELLTKLLFQTPNSIVVSYDVEGLRCSISLTG